MLGKVRIKVRWGGELGVAGKGGGSALSDEISSFLYREKEGLPAIVIVRVYVTLWEHAR